MCCDDPIELECKSSCQDVILPYAATENHTVKTEFNGALVPLTFVLNASNYPVIDRSLLNENYTHIIGVYNASGTNVACYKITIHPSAICCEGENIQGERFLADYANINSEPFLLHYIGEGYTYGYRCTDASYCGQYVANGDEMIFTEVDDQRIPVQTAPRDTIPDHDTNSGSFHLTYDANWITFLESLPIAEHLTFRVSPFTGRHTLGYNHPDHAYPAVIADAGTVDPITEEKVTYGEGFQIEWKKGAKFSFTIEFLYKRGEYTEVGHTMTFRDDAYYINGAKVYPANLRTIKTT